MSADTIQPLLRQFRNQLAIIRVMRIGFVVLLVVAMFWTSTLPDPAGKRVMLSIFAAALIAWVLAVFTGVRNARELQVGKVLLAGGQLDDADVWLRKAITRFSLSANTKLMACAQLALLFAQRDAHQDVVSIAQELLRYRLSRLHKIWLNTRLLMADSLLLLNQVSAAYEAIQPVYGTPLSLADRMKLLPIQLRYELAADHSASAIQALTEKVQITELLDSPRAALVHALLAEACRREGMQAQHAFLAERARLYHNLDQLAERYPQIAPIARSTQKPSPNQ